ncbi:MAG: glycosyltransferase [Hyphomicrobiaceae bacterium]|nr:glycosyltransferase [Hyphomicrobiaceae bacterium]
MSLSSTAAETSTAERPTPSPARVIGTPPYRLAVIHSFDPRGTKVGGLETFIRDMIAFLPDDFSFLMVGVDGTGDLELGKVVTREFRGRPYEFLPILHYPDAKAHEAAQRITDSINFQFMRALMTHLPTVRRVLRERPTSADMQRVEFASLVRGMGVPFTQMLHGEGAPKLQMDSLLKSYRYVHNINERLAVMACDKFLCVNPIITERIRATYPRHAHKIDTLSTWVDTKTYRPSPFPTDGGFRVAFAGRLDLFKRPPLMFLTMAALRRRLGGGVEFHYMGKSDPERFPEFDAIRSYTVLHGFRSATEVADVHRHCHAGILTSEFEGMPFSVLETLASGRPMGSIHLPQLDAVIRDGLSGTQVARRALPDGSPDEPAMAERLADAFVALRQAQIDGRLTPEGVASAVADFTPERQLAKCYANHRALQNKRWPVRVMG